MSINFSFIYLCSVSFIIISSVAFIIGLYRKFKEKKKRIRLKAKTVLQKSATFQGESEI